MPKYIKFADVQLRLAGKIRFQDDSGTDQSNRMPVALANRLIDEAEGQVEMDLSPRYAAPFAHSTTNLFKDLPDAPTKNIIRTLCELQAVMRVLETDFGSGTAVDANKYIKVVEDRYKKMLNENILAKFADDYKSTRQWKFPPLPFLKLNYFNKEADDGFAGMIIHETRGEGVYPAQQQNDPSESWFNADFSEDQ